MNPAAARRIDRTGSANNPGEVGNAVQRVTGRDSIREPTMPEPIIYIDRSRILPGKLEEMKTRTDR